MTGISVPRGHRLLHVARGKHATHGQEKNQRIKQQRHTRTAAQIRVVQFQDYLLITDHIQVADFGVNNVKRLTSCIQNLFFLFRFEVGKLKPGNLHPALSPHSPSLNHGLGPFSGRLLTVAAT